ncbi:TetR/AcrR family transcriptional regulator [Croceivirga thetidis]|uniref:TetR/AcrR family transcriptional regulator n=1 Tax=Croceivirga thetidis TaxID=2721623 RepID=A0ABX1GPE1_9FLAO|nr:TetR/AcrR family transcriptional regulator [Croceivirga thetidis]NKI30906.1 TetR/AcrR family transcriptional regulator [Croceivirga thetidis]
MIDRKEKILQTALRLFANHGYNGVSTNKIASEAEVSEGLIFRHYKNKQGLLDAILQQAFEKAAILYADIITEQDPKQVLWKSITLPFRGDPKEYDFWRLQFKLKWELEISGKEKMQPMTDKLTWAFTQLGYQEPEKEAQILQHIIESVSGGILKDGMASQEALKDFLLEKYRVN